MHVQFKYGTLVLWPPFLFTHLGYIHSLRVATRHSHVTSRIYVPYSLNITPTSSPDYVYKPNCGRSPLGILAVLQWLLTIIANSICCYLIGPKHGLYRSLCIDTTLFLHKTLVIIINCINSQNKHNFKTPQL